MTQSLRQRKALPERIRISFFDDPTGSTPLPLPSRRLWPVALVTGVFFAIMAAIAWSQISAIRLQEVKSVFDLTALLFQVFWVLGWSVGVFILGALTFLLLLFYGESARLQGGRLLYVPRLGPLRIRCEYDLAKIRNVRLEKVNAQSGDAVRIRFDYGEGSESLGDTMPRAQAEQLITAIKAAAAAPPGESLEPRSEPPGFDVLKWVQKLEARRESESKFVLQPEDSADRDQAVAAPPSWDSPSSLALIGANLVPIVGVLLFGWALGDIMVLFWVESAVIGFYNVLKMIVVEKWVAVVAAPFFVGHFGGFMAAHFMFIYYLNFALGTRGLS
jgi:hypothetical protein